MLDIHKIEAAINQISAEKKIDKSKLLEIIEHAIKTAYKKDFGTKDTNVEVKIDLANASIEVTVEKTIVDNVENPAIEIDIKDLGEAASEYQLGDTVEIDVSDEIMSNAEGFGRIASQAARQVIIQKIQEGEKEKIYNLFKNKEGEIVNLKIELVEKNKVLLDYNGNSIVLPKSEQVAKDKYTPGQRMYVYVGKVEEDTLTGPRVTLSRKNKNLVIKLFEMNVPELEDGTVEIIRIARNPGFKTKIIVGSEYEEVDPAGSLIGPKGIRVKAVVDELFGEKIDIINYTDDIKELIKKSLSPAQISDVKINTETREATCYVLGEEKVRAIGKGGANVNLATELTGYRISLVSNDEV
ncbi:MAG: transcription termination factor NusA [Candidatus Gracilibacteria bacterium]|nr:transcription termination factor NusA [Candidatus Gracilibacteria bacterium]MDD2908157.1 transcription termination factor NusA [Candidatus Gracilibacteria bacterium]